MQYVLTYYYSQGFFFFCGNSVPFSPVPSESGGSEEKWTWRARRRSAVRADRADSRRATSRSSPTRRARAIVGISRSESTTHEGRVSSGKGQTGAPGPATGRRRSPGTAVAAPTQRRDLLFHCCRSSLAAGPFAAVRREAAASSFSGALTGGGRRATLGNGFRTRASQACRPRSPSAKSRICTPAPLGSCKSHRRTLPLASTTEIPGGPAWQ